MSAEPLLATVTGENFQPVRLHYRVLDPERLLPTFKQLRCLDRDPTRPRWVWLYDHEAKKLRFEQSYAQIPKHLHPVVIGSFFPRANDQLLLDLRSCERAVAAIPFFDKHLPRSVARVTEAEIVNQLFSATGNATLTPDSIFDQQTGMGRDPTATVQRIENLVANVKDPKERLRLAMEAMEAHSKQPVPEIERFPVHYYEDGIEGFASALKMRQIVAMQHWLGNTAYSLFDVIQSIHPTK
jgi:hypothetical protein